MPVQIQVASDCVRGNHAAYGHIVGSLGCKVYRRPHWRQAQREYIQTIYAHTSGLTVEPRAYGSVQVDFGSGLVRRPAIWLQHLCGTNVLQHCMQLGRGLNSSYSNEEAERAGFQHPSFVGLIEQMNHIIDVLREMGFECCDHEANLSNFVYNKRTGVVKAIDFSMEHIKDKLVIKKMLSMAGEKLNQTYPVEYLETLTKLGVVTLR